MNNTGKKIAFLLAPLALLAGMYFAMPHIAELPDFIVEQIPIIPYLTLVSAAILASIYKKYRLIMITLTLLTVYIVLQSINRTLVPEAHFSALGLLGVGITLTFLYLMITEERALFSIKTVISFVVISVQLFAGWWLIKEHGNLVTPIFRFELDLLMGFVNRTSLPTITLATYLLGSLILLARYIKSKTVFDSAYLGALLATALTLNSHLNPAAFSLYMGVGGLILVIALVQNAYFIAYIDELTELPGRRALNEEMSRLRGQYAIAMLDVDHFKNFNDTYGHDIGDQVLRMVAAKLAKVGGGGRPFRYGGEEFCIVFPGKDMKATFPYLSTVRQAIDDTRMVLRNKDRPEKRPEKITPQRRRKPWREVHVTISIGVAEKGGKLYGTEEVIKAADTALYKAKEKGRNRISQYGSSSTAEQPA